MTSNQINYQKNLELERSNKAQERIAAQELAIKKASLRETQRSNLAKELETERSNRVRETETARSNVAHENLQAMNNAIVGEHYYRSDTEAARSNQAKETETHRSNVTDEEHRSSVLSADIEKHTTDKIAAANKYAGAAYALGSRDTSFTISQLGDSILNMLGINRKGNTHYVYDYTNSAELLPHYGSE